MSSDAKIRTVYTQDLIEISLQSNENLDVLLDLIKDKISRDDNLRTHIFSTLTFKDEDQKEVVISKTTLDALLSLVVARAAAIDELNTFSYSLSLH